MTGWLDVLLVLAFATILGGVSALAFHLGMTPAAARPTLGGRGLNRANALRRGGLFALVEPLVRLLAGWVSVAPLERIRRPVRRSLIHAGEYLGLSEDELIALCALSGSGAGLIGLLVCELLGLPGSLVMAALCVGIMTPWFRVLAVAQARARSVSRGLPPRLPRGAQANCL